MDQVVLEDMLPENTQKLENQELDEDKPGLGQFYCVICSRYFISELAFKMHLQSKTHKKRVKSTQDIPYSHEEAERAGGLQPEKVKFTNLIYDGKTKMADFYGQNEKKDEDMG